LYTKAESASVTVYTDGGETSLRDRIASSSDFSTDSITPHSNLLGAYLGAVMVLYTLYLCQFQWY